MMERDFLRRPKFMLERWVQRGILAQLLLMAGLIAVVSGLGGLAAWALTREFPELSTAAWWAFLRLTDPGYLGDDEGTALRVISTVVTVLGYVLFMGSLIAIMTQWLAQTIRKLESGLTPIAMENHFVILGWTNRTPEIIKKLLTARGRLERFLEGRGGSTRLRIVVLADEVDAARRQELRDTLKDSWDESQIFLRSGSSLQRDHLERLDILRASVVVIPGADFELGGAELTDTRVLKTLLTLDALFGSKHREKLPRVVAELFDPHKVPIARAATGARVEIIAGDRLVSRFLTQGLRETRIARVILGLMTHREGNALYVRSFPDLEGRRLPDLTEVFPTAIVLGIVSQVDGVTTVDLDPQQDAVLGEGDLLVLLAQTYDACEPGPDRPGPRARAEIRTLPPKRTPEVRRLLILGWSYKIPTLLEELLESGAGLIEVTIMSKVDDGTRRAALRHLDPAERLSIKNLQGDYSMENDLSRVEPERFDQIFFMASGWMASGWMATSDHADARTILGVLTLQALFRGRRHPPEIVVEFLDPENARLLEGAADVVFISPLMLSHLLAHVGLRPELNAVFDALICSGGMGIELRPISDLGLPSSGATFREAQHAAAACGSVCLGFYAGEQTEASPPFHLNPPRDLPWTFGPDDCVILLSRDEHHAVR